ncbi:MAG: energy transducer TonB, partial [Gemmatimonadaceae bacterium]
VPPAFVVPFGPTACGTIIIWSRHGEARQRGTMTVTQLAALLTSLQVYAADQVDEPARVDTSALVAPVYPEALHKSHTPGQVIAEFVVDTTGKAEPATFGVVSSTDARFTEAVRLALPNARFKPAVLHGGRVRQIVRQSFAFVVPRDGGKSPG